MPTSPDGDLLQICPRLCQPVQCIREVLLTFRAEFAVEGIQCNLALGQGYEALKINDAIIDPARTQQIVRALTRCAVAANADNHLSSRSSIS